MDRSQHSSWRLLSISDRLWNYWYHLKEVTSLWCIFNFLTFNWRKFSNRDQLDTVLLYGISLDPPGATVLSSVHPMEFRSGDLEGHVLDSRSLDHFLRIWTYVCPALAEAARFSFQISGYSWHHLASRGSQSIWRINQTITDPHLL